MTADIVLSLSGGELVFTGDASVSSLAVTYDPADEAYTLTANSGATFAADGTVPSTVVFGSSGNVATLAPDTGDGYDWSSLGYSAGADLTATGAQVVLGSGGPGGAPASNFATPFDVATSVGGTTSLVVDDEDGEGGATDSISDTDLVLGTSADVSYGEASLTGLTFYTSDVGGSTINVASSPSTGSGLAPITLSTGTGGTNTVNLGDPTHPAAGLGDVAVDSGGSATEMTIDDSDDAVGQSVTVSPTSVSFAGGPSFDVSDADLDDLTLDASDAGSNTVTVAGTPPVNILTLAMGSGQGNQLDYGTPTQAAAGVGSLAITGETYLTIDDSADSGRSVVVSSTLTNFGNGTVLYYVGAPLDGMTYKASEGGGDDLIVSGVQPSGLTLALGTGGTDAVDLGDGGASSLSNVMLQSGGTVTALEVDDRNDFSPAPSVEIGSSQLAFGGGPTINYSDAPLSSLTFDASDQGGNSVQIDGVPTTGTGMTPITLNMGAGAGNSAYDGGRFSAWGALTVTTGTGGSTSLQLDDSSGNAGLTYTVTPTSISVSGGPTITYAGANLTGLQLDEGNSGDETVDVAGMPSLLDGGALGIGAFVGTGDAVNLGDAADAASLLGNVSLAFGDPAAVTIDDADDPASRSATLSYDAGDGDGDLAGLGSANIAYQVGSIGTLTLMDSAIPGASTGLTVDFAGGNPFAAQGSNAPMTLDDDGVLGDADTLTFEDSGHPDTPDFASETVTPSGAEGGSVSFFDASSADQGGVQFSDLASLTDSAPVTKFTFFAPLSGGTIAVTNASTPGYTLISDPSPSPSFWPVVYSNKASVTIDATRVVRGDRIVLNNPATATGQTALAVDLGSGSDTVNVLANPAGVATTIDGGVGTQAVTVVGSGLAAGTGAANFSILGGAGASTLRLDAQGTGSAATLTAGTADSPAVATFGAGEAATSFAFQDMAAVQGFADNNAPTFAAPGTPPTIPATVGLALVDVPVATFSDADAIENAGSYAATIDWGDGTSPTAGTIAAVPGQPGTYVVTGSHAYAAAGRSTITVTLTDLGGTFNSTLVNDGGIGVPASTQLGPIAAVGAATATASVTTSDPVTISGTVALDVAGTGTVVAGDPGLAGRVVFLDLNHDGMLDPGDPSATTDASGDFTIAGLAPATYTLRLVAMPGDVNTSPAGGSIAVDAAESVAGQDFAVQTMSSIFPVPVTSAPFAPTPSPNTDTAVVKGLYNLVLDRAADSTGLATWVGELESGAMTVAQVAAAFYASTEYDTRVVEFDYETFLGRAADQAGLSDWVAMMQSGWTEQQVAVAFLSSAEFSQDHPDDPSFVQALYADVLNRSGSTTEVSAWVSALDSGASRSAVADDIVTSIEAETDAIRDDYIAFLGRTPAAPEAAAWLSGLRDGSWTLDGIAEGILGSPEFSSRAAKTAVA